MTRDPSSIPILQRILYRQSEAALGALEDAVLACPDHLWTASLWSVRKDDPNVWPVRQVSGARTRGQPDQEELLQWHSAFWNVAYHAAFFVDADASTSTAENFAPPPPFQKEDHEPHVVPDRVYGREEIEGYLDYVRTETLDAIAGMSDAGATQQVADHRHGPRSFAEVVSASLSHALEHAAQLHMFLGQRQN